MRRAIAVPAYLLLAAMLLLTIARLSDTRSAAVVGVAAFASYAVLGYAVALVVLLALARRRAGRAPAVLAALVAAAGLVVHAAWWVPAWTSAPVGDATGSAYTVVSANLEFGRGDPDEVVRLVEAERPALLVLQEVTPSAMTALDRAGIADRLPHRAGEPTPGVRGTVVLSRWPLGRVAPDFDLGNGALQVPVAAPVPFVLLAVHAAMPLASAPAWHADLDRLRERVARLRDRPLLVVGDLNATTGHAPLRDVLDAGVRDAAEQAGSGWEPTWPTQYRRPWLRPVLALDHVLVGESTVATATRTVTVTGTDHRALVVRLQARGER